MIKVIADITMSLDGFVTGGGADPQHGLGDAPELHRWVTEQDDVDIEILVQSTAASGAVVMGGGCSTPSTAPTDRTRTWGTAPIRPGPRRSSSSPTRHPQTSARNATSGCGSPSSVIWLRRSTGRGQPQPMATS